MVGCKQKLIDFVETAVVDAEHGERFLRYAMCDAAGGSDFHPPGRGWSPFSPAVSAIPTVR